MEQKSDKRFPTIFFDGVCNLCNGFIDFLIRSDRQRRFRYAPLQGRTAQTVLPRGEISSIVYWRQGQAFRESDAVLEIFSDLGGVWKATQALRIFPRALRDPVYRFVAKNRYRWFGKRETCRLPTPEERALFLD